MYQMAILNASEILKNQFHASKAVGQLPESRQLANHSSLITRLRQGYGGQASHRLRQGYRRRAKRFGGQAGSAS